MDLLRLVWRALLTYKEGAQSEEELRYPLGHHCGTVVYINERERMNFHQLPQSCLPAPKSRPFLPLSGSPL